MSIEESFEEIVKNKAKHMQSFGWEILACFFHSVVLTRVTHEVRIA